MKAFNTANVDSDSENNSGGLITFNQTIATSNITNNFTTAEIGRARTLRLTTSNSLRPTRTSS